MEEEIKILFKMEYMPIAYSNNRFNGNDFLSVAIPLIDNMRKEKPDEECLKKAARIMVLEFNALLDPPMNRQDIEDAVNTVCNPSPAIRAMIQRSTGKSI